MNNNKECHGFIKPIQGGASTSRALTKSGGQGVGGAAAHTEGMGGGNQSTSGGNAHAALADPISRGFAKGCAVKVAGRKGGKRHRLLLPADLFAEAESFAKAQGKSLETVLVEALQWGIEKLGGHIETASKP